MPTLPIMTIKRARPPDALMNLATYLPQLNGQALEQRIRAVGRRLPSWVSYLLIIVIAYKLAELTWILLPQGTSSAQKPTVTVATLGQTRTIGSNPDASRIIEAHLFGSAPSDALAPVAEEILEAPDTTLNLKLVGMVSVSGGKGESGIAIITNGNGEQKTYQVGQTIDGGNGARLHTVYTDRVIVNWNGRLESLRLPKEISRNPLAVIPRVATPTTATPVREIISANASRITDIVRVAPHIEQGQMIGFRISPGKDQEQFASLGLLPGDVVTDINGIPMTDPSRGLQVFEALGEGAIANVTIIREGEAQVLAINTSQLESLAKNRQ